MVPFAARPNVFAEFIDPHGSFAAFVMTSHDTSYVQTH
jgi:hypothetical protein